MKVRILLLTLIFLAACVPLTAEQIEDARYEQRRVDAVFFTAKAIKICEARGSEVKNTVINYSPGGEFRAGCADSHEIAEGGVQ